MNISTKKNKQKITYDKLYNANKYPNKSIKGTGFANKEKAISTIKRIQKLSIKKQLPIIITMYYRAKYHPHQTNDMKESMKIFKKWLDNYKKIKEKP